ncbi:MAG: hypothetical protein Q7Q73_00485 [Verrucomicrobiota bacterium JB024]|nr:hypothetical protein [Verrucomicrobiota bacterium JB024]
MNTTYCADGSVNEVFYKFHLCWVLIEKEQTYYTGGTNCPSDSAWVATGETKRGAEVGWPQTRAVTDNGCSTEREDDDDDGKTSGGGGNDDCDGDGIPNSIDATPGCDDDDDDPSECYTLSETNRDASQDNSCVTYYEPDYIPPADDASTLPNPNGLNIIYESIGEVIPRPGFSQFGEIPDDPENVVTYLKKVYTRARDGGNGCFEDGGTVYGKTTYEYDTSSLERCTSYEGYDYTWYKSGETIDSGETDTSKWTTTQFTYGDNKTFNVKYSYELTNSFTTSQFRQYAEGVMPDFSGKYPYASSNSLGISASYDLDGSSTIYYRKVKFKFKWGSNVTADQRHPVVYFVVFIPEDDPDTATDESDNFQIIYSKTITWDGASSESPMSYELDPGAIDSSKDGVYRLLYVDLISPAGGANNDPINLPIDGGDGTGAVTSGANEFTFSAANPGVLTIPFQASVSGPLTAQQISSLVTFTVENIGQAPTWDSANPGGLASVQNGSLTAKATFTGLPANNTDFGTKTVSVKLGSQVAEEAEIEVFFRRDEKNHPGPKNGITPNWLYYWLQTLTPLGPNPKFNYDVSSYYDPSTNAIFLSDGDRGSYDAPYGKNNPLEGIDNFAWTVFHESQHYLDWVNYWDVENDGITNWQNAYGGLDPNDNKDPHETSRGGSDYLPNYVEDVNLNQDYDQGDLYDWSNGLTGNPPSTIIDDAEDYTCQRHTSVVGDHSLDWADPGMQHNTLDVYHD